MPVCHHALRNEAAPGERSYESYPDSWTGACPATGTGLVSDMHGANTKGVRGRG